MTILFSFSLQGKDPRYTKGVEENLKSIRKLFGNAHMVVYSPDDPSDYVFGDKTGLHWEKVEPRDDNSCHFWRFKAISNVEYDYVCVRDIDSLVSLREHAAVMHWIETGKSFHCMRDHYWHTEAGGAPFPIQGGMWGAKPSSAPKNWSILVDYWLTNKAPFGRYSDMWFLNRFIYPLLLTDGIQHDGCGSHWTGLSFPTRREGNDFVGQVEGWS